jgi:hypothetical protein
MQNKSHLQQRSSGAETTQTYTRHLNVSAASHWPRYNSVRGNAYTLATHHDAAHQHSVLFCHSALATPISGAEKPPHAPNLLVKAAAHQTEPSACSSTAKRSSPASWWPLSEHMPSAKRLPAGGDINSAL